MQIFLNREGPAAPALLYLLLVRLESVSVDLFHQIPGHSHLLYLIQLSLEPIYVIFFFEDGFKQLSGSVVTEFGGQSNTVVV